MDYKKAGVDIEAGYKSVELMKEHVKRTMREEVLGGLGGFSGAFSLKKIKDMDDPVLLSGTDGCGTKVKLAMILDKHDTIGIDAVAMCVNDIACAGGEPLFFLDYIACGKNYPEKIAEIVSGVAEGCVQSDAALIGGMDKKSAENLKLENLIKEQRIYISSNYEAYLGKEYVTVEKLTELKQVMISGGAATVAQALAVYREKHL